MQMTDTAWHTDVFLVCDKEALLFSLSEPSQNISSKEQLPENSQNIMRRESSFLVKLQAV